MFVCANIVVLFLIPPAPVGRFPPFRKGGEFLGRCTISGFPFLIPPAPAGRFPPFRKGGEFGWGSAISGFSFLIPPLLPLVAFPPLGKGESFWGGECDKLVKQKGSLMSANHDTCKASCMLSSTENSSSIF